MAVLRTDDECSCSWLACPTGEDGPTHQPVEALSSLRATPNILVLRPADGNETSGAYTVAIESRSRPSVLSLSRQNVDNLEGTSVEKVKLGTRARARNSAVVAWRPHLTKCIV